VREMWRRLVARLRAGSVDADVSEELRFHAEMKTRDTGDPDAAARASGVPCAGTNLRATRGRGDGWTT